MHALHIGLWLFGFRAPAPLRLPLPPPFAEPCAVSAAVSVLPFGYYLQQLGGWAFLRRARVHSAEATSGQDDREGSGRDGAREKVD